MSLKQKQFKHSASTASPATPPANAESMSAAQVAHSDPPFQPDEVAQVAYDLYEKQGANSNAVENWLEAERIVRSRYQAPETTTLSHENRSGIMDE